MPTPPAAPLMSRCSPAPSPHWVKRASCEVVNASGEPAGFEGPEGVRHRHGRPLLHDRQLGLPPTADHGHDPVTHAEAQDAGPDRGHDAGKLEARDVRRGARRSRVPTGSLQQVRSIQAGGLDFDEKFARPRNRVGLLLHDD